MAKKKFSREEDDAEQGFDGNRAAIYNKSIDSARKKAQI